MKKENVVVKLNGGLGNQMFQWALARMIQETTDMEALLDMSFFEKKYARPYQLDIFRFEPTFLNDAYTKTKLAFIWKFRAFIRWEKILGWYVFSEKQFNFDPIITKIRPNTYIEGFFQSERYFKSIEEKIREDFKFTRIPDETNRRIIRFINAGPSVSLHIRRGDYVSKKRYKKVYAQCSLDYYKRAVEYIAQKEPKVRLFIFSDDIPWVKENLKLPFETIYVSHNSGAQSYEDMRLMSLCTHNVIANSSFSWWGAWLNKNKEKIVIAPKKWFNDDRIIQTDVIPKDWIQLEN